MLQMDGLLNNQNKKGAIMSNNETILSINTFTQLIKARDCFEKRNFSEALKICLPIYKKTASARVAYIISLCYFQVSDFPSANNWINKAISIDRMENIPLLAFYKWMDCDYKSAAELYKEILDQNPNDTFALQQIISIYGTPGGEKWVNEDFAKDCLLTLSKSSVENLSYIYYLLGKIEYNHGEYAKAKIDLEKAAVYGRSLGERINKDMIEMMGIIIEETSQ